MADHFARVVFLYISVCLLCQYWLVLFIDLITIEDKGNIYTRIKLDKFSESS